MSRWLIPSCIAYRPLPHGHAALTVYFSNGQRGQLDGQATSIYDVETILLEAMAHKSPVDLSRWPSMTVRKTHRRRVW